MRLVYYMKDSDWPKKSMVAKALLGQQHSSQDDMLHFCQSTERAIHFRSQFLHDLKQLRRKIDLWFVKCYLYKYKHDGDEGYFVAEQLLEGRFVKFNNNDGYVNPDHEHTEGMQAFSHFTYVASRGKEMVVDLQGVVDGTTILLTDPQSLSRSGDYGPGDRGFKGMKAFFATHLCGETCNALNLNGKMSSLREELDLEHRRCIICCDAPRGTVLNPCGHSLMCRKCVLKVMEAQQGCPSCKADIEGFDEGLCSKTYLPNAERKRIRRRHKRR
mmetsp:Transcript_25112/g.81178  ORF Transcript_25112/g.81178 Transcript_25112/m.81178 type:complete len:272 (+) Transcript_25112:609-1424(+)